jgi:hypothetical protein
LKKALRELNEFTCHQFDWDIIGGSVEREKRIDGEGELDGDDDEDGPVVVDMTVENDEMHGN